MKINEVKGRVNASYNTIKKFIQKNPQHYEMIDNILHVTELGYEKLIEVYGLKTDILSEDSVDFYKIQLKLLHDQLQETRQYNQTFRIQIENKDFKVEELSKEVKNIEQRLHEKELEVLKIKNELDIEKNKSIIRKIFGK